MTSDPRVRIRFNRLALAIGTLLAAVAASAQEAASGQASPEPGDARAEQPVEVTPPIEEVVAVGRFLSAAESLSTERLELPVSADFLSSEVIGRAGDTDIAAALRRVPGVTLVNGEFVYVRGLGERYSSVLLNGAAIPSPDLTRSVVPLDLFPTSMVESIKIQKSPSPDATAAFGGGMIDVRTLSVPRDVVASFDIGFGYNSISNGDVLTSSAGGSALPTPIVDAISVYRGDVSVSNILSSLRQTDPLASISDAQVIHQGLVDSLDSNVAIRTESADPDMGAKLALGNSWDIGDSWTLGVLLNGNYDEKWRNQDQHREGVGNPGDNFVDIQRSVYEERTVSSLQLGLDYSSDHSVEISRYVIKTDEDESSISRGFDQNNEFPDEKVGYETRLQERELDLTQISGSHTFLDTPGITRFLERRGWEDLTFDWFYTESEATTAVPNETFFQAAALLDPSTGEELSTQVLATTSSGQFSFLDLEDNLDSWGGTISLPLHPEKLDVTLSGGWWASEKSRDYAQHNVNLNSVGVPSSFLSGAPGDMFARGGVQVDNGFDLSLGTNFGTESYLAAQTVDAIHGSVDLELDSWRFMVGGRWEDYRQAVLPIDLLDFSGVSIRALQQALNDPAQRLAIEEDDAYGSMALTYNGAGALGSDDYQLRLSYGQTVVRPDLREVADVIYIDPELDIRVQGNPVLRSSPIDNFEIRSEFFYGDGNNFTVSLFYKDIQSPIEQVRFAGSDDDVVLGFQNARAGEVSGIELEGLKQLPAGLFVSGNMTLSDSEIRLDPDLPTFLTNSVRRLTGHSEWVVNATLGFDAPSGLHSAYLNFNAFGDRIFYAGTGQNDDAYEQPFHSLGLVYKYFPTDSLQFEVKLDNLLGEDRVFEQKNSSGDVARILSQEVGRSASLGVRWSF